MKDSSALHIKTYIFILLMVLFAPLGNILLGNWGKMNPQQARKFLEEMIISAKYIEKATTFQKKSFQDLASGIRVSTQVTKQLSTNSSKALESATLMEEVVEQLRDVVGQ